MDYKGDIIIDPKYDLTLILLSKYWYNNLKGVELYGEEKENS